MALEQIPSDGVAATERHARIIDAAERCFARAGFYRTTMQDVAAEAGMSPGNLYRYFPSKDAIVVGLVERDRARMAADFAATETADDIMTAFRELGRKHFADEPRSKAILCLDIWAEATRNPIIARLTMDLQREIVDRLASVVAMAQARGAAASDIDCVAAAAMIATLGNGLFVRRAISPDFDAERDVGHALAMIGALLRGGVAANSKTQQDAETSS